MPMRYSIDPDKRLIQMVGVGKLIDEEMLECVKALRSDPNVEPDMPTLSDMRHIEVGFTADGVLRMLGIMEDESGVPRSSARAAIVVSSDVAFGMGRMVEMLSDKRIDPSFQIFRSMDDAREWLGVK